jgi:hypothetical protein
MVRSSFGTAVKAFFRLLSDSSGSPDGVSGESLVTELATDTGLDLLLCEPGKSGGGSKPRSPFCRFRDAMALLYAGFVAASAEA